MKSHSILCILCALLFASASPAFASVVLLHGGQVVQGDASLVEGVYHINTGTGQIRIAVNRVERLFDKMEDVYRWKRTLIRIGNHSEHIELARWCLKYDLLDLAQGELVDAELAEQRTPMVDYLQRRLTARRNAKTTDTPQLLAPLPSGKPLPKVAPLTASPEEAVSLEALEELAASISPKSMAQFSRTVQPILLNNCATGGCHVGSGNEKMRLYRNGLAGKAGRHTTRRNLYAVMECITPDRPDYSPLLTIPLYPHGKNSRAMVKGHRAAYQRLVYWVMQVSREQNAKKSAKSSGFKQVNFDGSVQPATHTEPAKPGGSASPRKSIVRETLDLIPPKGANLQKKGKDGRLEPIYPSDNVTSTSPLRKALAVNPRVLESFIKKTEDRK